MRKSYFDALADVGPDPLVVNINSISENNTYFRSTLWTGEHMQVTVMNIDVGEEIGAEVHEDTDQFIKVESGRAKILIGYSADEYYYQRLIDKDFAVIIPAGVWHNIVNLGNTPLKLYSIYAPPHHPSGTVNTTKAEG